MQIAARMPNMADLAGRLRALWVGAAAPKGTPVPAAPARSRVPPTPVPALGRLDIQQWLWGEGFDRPGDGPSACMLVKPFGLTRDSRLLDLGVGLGGAADAIAGQFGCRVVGLERDPEAARIAARMLATSKDADATPLAEGLPKLRPASFDRVLSRFATHEEPDKERLLDAVSNTMREGGQILLLEYVDGDAGDRPLDGWRAALGGAARIWTEAKWRETLGALGFDLRIVEDFGEAHRRAILAGWARLLQERDLRAMPRPHKVKVLLEAERWLREYAAIEQGALRVLRLLAIAPR